MITRADATAAEETVVAEVFIIALPPERVFRRAHSKRRLMRWFFYRPFVALEVVRRARTQR
jgi:uncharacterized protein YndB with AHSA1/START domain